MHLIFFAGVLLFNKLYFFCKTGVFRKKNFECLQFKNRGFLQPFLTIPQKMYFLVSQHKKTKIKKKTHILLIQQTPNRSEYFF